MEILENSHVAWKNVRIETVLGQIWNESVCVCVRWNDDVRTRRVTYKASYEKCVK